MPYFVTRALRSATVVSLRGVSGCFMYLLLAILVGWGGFVHAQNPAPGPNSDPTYQALRN